jgi:Thermophilic metalloprotease (M29)
MTGNHRVSVSREILETGFGILLTSCLHARRDDNLLVIYDENFEALLPALQDVVIKEELPTAFVVIPKAYQLAMTTRSRGEGVLVELPRCFEAACGEATIILNCLSPDLATAPVREAVLKTFRANGCRFAHIPGISGEILEILTRSPIDDILQASDGIAWALGEAEKAILRSYDDHGNSYDLTMELDGWDNEPLMSPGVIFEGSWGNVPPGEVFCCPDPRRVNGFIWINGSLPGKKLNPEVSGLLEFRSGRAVARGGPDSLVFSFIEQQGRLAEQKGDPNWNVFAELGIGLNPAITSLTGNSLLDEKALGTVHVAIGNNRAFGHDVVSQIHADMVTLKPDLLLDGLPIMSKGELNFEVIRQSRLNHKINQTHFKPNDRLGLREVKLELGERQALRRLVSGDRVGYVLITDDFDLLPLARLKQLLPDGYRATYDSLKAVLKSDELDHLLSVLQHYRVLVIE